MADYYPCQITIGGKLHESKLEAFFNALESDGLGPDWDDQFKEGEFDQFEQDIRQLMKENIHEPKTFMVNEARWGEVDSTKKFCYEHKLTFSAHHDASYDSNRCISWWKPGMDRAQETICDVDGDPLVHISEIQEYLDNNSQSTSAKVHRLQALFRVIKPCIVPPFILQIDPIVHRRRQVWDTIQKRRGGNLK